MHPPRNKAIVGENAFAHEAGIHQHGMLQHASTYEIMRPEPTSASVSRILFLANTAAVMRFATG